MENQNISKNYYRNKEMPSLSLIVPTLNEEKNIKPLVKRIEDTLGTNNINYEIVFIDDKSTDKTQKEVKKLMDKFPLYFYTKKGQQGKAYSLLEGFEYAKYENVGFIDADLQYPPEAILPMLDKLQNGASVVVANRKHRDSSLHRKVFSYTFRTVFGKILHGLECDVQSGLKVFKKEVVDHVKISPTPWTFDLDFLRYARSFGHKIETVDINFAERNSGDSKIKPLQAIKEIGWASIKSKFKNLEPIPLSKDKKKKYAKGFLHNGTRYIHHSDLKPEESALENLIPKQKIIILLLLMAITALLLFNWQGLLTLIMTIITFIYFLNFIFNAYLIYRSFAYNPEIKIKDSEIKKLKYHDLPVYTIFCPLYKEWRVLPQFIEAIAGLDYPKNKLQVLLLFEEDDKKSIEKARLLDLPDHFEIVVVPDSLPKTKPKACNYGLQKAVGKYSVIYDAEDIPDPLQIKKAVVAFAKSDKNVVCVQAKLNYYNSEQNILTRLFTAEYSLWFDLILTGLQSINAPIPLGGTSNHFLTKDLKKLKGWDAFNVTEDCDLGIRLVKKGYRTAIFDSVTMEEANSNLNNWFNQRTRWIKGYIQTYFVHMRNSKNYFNFKSKSLFLAFQLVIGGTIFSMLTNPFMWILTLSYFVFRPYIGETIESFFPAPVFYMGIFSMIFGNFIYLYNYMIALSKKRKYNLIKYSYLIPFYWMLMSAAAWVAAYRFLIEPHYWFKTQHGLHLGDSDKDIKIKTSPQIAAFDIQHK